MITTINLRRVPGSLCCMALLSSAAVAGPLEEMEARTWYQIPNSNLESVKPNPIPDGGGIEGLFAWAGGAFDVKRNRLLIWGGGHTNYSGNEIYAFDVNTLKWSRIWGPSTNIPETGTSDTYGDGNPSSRHTYDNLVYNPKRDAFFSHGGSLSWSGSWTTGTWEFDLANGAWLKRAAGTASMFSQTSYDPKTGLIIKVAESATYEFNPETNAWKQRASKGNDSKWEPTGEIDPVRNVMVLLGGGRFRVINLATNAVSDPVPTGDTDILSAYAPGLTWDSNSQKLVAWSGGTAVYIIDISENLSAYAIRKVTPIAANKVTPSPRHPQGTYSRFQYSPKANAFLVVNNVDEGVYAFKLTSGTGPTSRIIPQGGSIRLEHHRNSATGQLEFRLEGGRDEQIAAQLFDVHGKLIADLSAGLRKQGRATLGRGSHSAGTYMLRTVREGGLHVESINLR